MERFSYVKRSSTRPAVGCIVWLDLFGRPNDYEEAGQSAGDDPTRNHVWGVARFGTSFRKINHESERQTVERPGSYPGPPSAGWG